MRKVELLPTRNCEAGYGPGLIDLKFYQVLTWIVIHKKTGKDLQVKGQGF